MKTTLNLLGLSLLLLVLRCSLDTIADYGAFNVTITNKGTTTITDIELFMIGAEETMTIKELDPGQSTESLLAGVIIGYILLKEILLRILAY
jgi:hypothetical protein